MEITLNHTIVSSHDNISSAKYYERIFGFEFIQEWGIFAVVKVNQTFTLDFMNESDFSSQHYAFKVSDKQFDEIFDRVKNESIAFGSGPLTFDDGKINNNDGGRGVYFKDPNGHLLEILTTDYVLD
ncbi:MAG: VOC family protein [Photobacterium frigidiphilum]|jgi:catechol 2,3-dioxygenase-like lactoylglutathione lyase family enzyme|uniref:VOC family protein n=1 Tax=Photobacterium frigidiphilum TaxID=264736 RepID=UPI00300274F8